jgi:hypothetical protein
VFIMMPPGLVHGTLSCSLSQSPPWQICGPIQTLTGINQSPSAIQASDGTLRLAWTHIITSGLNAGASLIYYSSRLLNGTWVCNCSITSQGGHNQNPSIVQASNSTVFVFWSYKATTSNHYQIYYRYLKGTVWSGYRPVPLKTPTTLNDTLPATAVGKDGTLWLVWTRDNSTAAGSTPIMRQLWYETLNSTGWSVNEQNITRSNDVNWNFQPSVMVGKDGTPRVVYANGTQSSVAFQINYIYRVGSAWSHPAKISNSNPTANDANPSLIQDRNGTIWTFWTRDMTTNFAIREIYSTDNGATWRGETQLTSSCSTCADSKDPTALQSTTDKGIWVFYSTNPGVTGFNIWSLQSGPIAPIHNVDLNNVTCGVCSQQYSGGLASIGQSANLTITVTLSNPGDYNEPITVSLAATNRTNYALGSQSATINAGSSILLVFYWNTTNVKAARYGLSASLSPIVGESLANQVDNSLSLPNQAHILPLGDVDQDGSVTITDVSVFFYDYNGVRGVVGSRYNPYCDIINTGFINIVDIGVVLANYNTFS